MEILHISILIEHLEAIEAIGLDAKFYTKLVI